MARRLLLALALNVAAIAAAPGDGIELAMGSAAALLLPALSLGPPGAGFQRRGHAPHGRGGASLISSYAIGNALAVGGRRRAADAEVVRAAERRVRPPCREGVEVVVVVGAELERRGVGGGAAPLGRGAAPPAVERAVAAVHVADAEQRHARAAAQAAARHAQQVRRERYVGPGVVRP